MSRTHHHGDRNKKALFGKFWWWMSQEPKGWRRLYKHKPRRAELKVSLHRFLEGHEVVWPLNSKPWIYYW